MFQRYTKKDMIEFGKYAKSYGSPRKIEDAFDSFEMGERVVGNVKTNAEKIMTRYRRANITYLDGKSIRSRFGEVDENRFFNEISAAKCRISKWDSKNKILNLISL